ncbi:MAG: DoxX family protein [Archangium sp.]|nr:DoxX family protein [Archangium sp.]MDP3151863.1 DoxX family protein [Archangium sp.]MDP3574392.1 DoxX family protein [Archangium sp.]
MKKIVSALPRVLLGFILFASGLAGLLNLIPPPPESMQGAAALYMSGLGGTYLITLVKLTEVTAGVLLLANRFVPLALVIIAPVVINIAAFHLFYAPSGLAVPVLMIAAQLYVAWQHRAAFVPVLEAKQAAA